MHAPAEFAVRDENQHNAPPPTGKGENSLPVSSPQPHGDIEGQKEILRGKAISMNHRAEDAATKILLAFESGGIAPLESGKFALVPEHVRSILVRPMENAGEKKKRKWTDFQRVKAERQ